MQRNRSYSRSCFEYKFVFSTWQTCNKWLRYNWKKGQPQLSLTRIWHVVIGYQQCFRWNLCHTNTNDKCAIQAFWLSLLFCRYMQELYPHEIPAILKSLLMWCFCQTYLSKIYFTVKKWYVAIQGRRSILFYERFYLCLNAAYLTSWAKPQTEIKAKTKPICQA